MNKLTILFLCTTSIASFSLFAADPRPHAQIVIISDQPIDVNRALLTRERIILEAERRVLIFGIEARMPSTSGMRGRRRGCRLGADAVNDNPPSLQPVRLDDASQEAIKRSQAQIAEIDKRLAELAQQEAPQDDTHQSQGDGPIDAEAE